MRSRGLVIFDGFNTLATSRRGSKRTFLAGLVQTGIRASTAMLADLAGPFAMVRLPSGVLRVGCRNPGRARAGRRRAGH